MDNSPKGRTFILVSLPLLGLALITALFSKSIYLASTVIVLVILVLAALAASQIRSAGRSAALRQIYKREESRDRSGAAGLIIELLTSEQGGQSRNSMAATLISTHFRMEKLVIFFREKDRYVPRVFYGIRPSGLSRPKTSMLNFAFKDLPTSGRVYNMGKLFHTMFKNNDWEYYRSPVAYCFRRGRSVRMILLGDDDNGLLAAVADDPAFGEIFWPALESFVRGDNRLNETMAENNRLHRDIASIKKEISGLNRDLNQKLLDLQSFVEVSGQLYNILDEDQLFATLKDVIRTKMGAQKSEILCSDGESRFVPYSSQEPVSQIQAGLSLDSDSQLFEMLRKNPKPLLLPVIGSGLEDEPFLDEAIRNGFQVASAIRVGSRTGCILLVGERQDRKHYTDFDLDFLSTIANIASLSLENIRQYAVIEKMSYTDSMTGVYNYRYFYKRLIEEILRARRFGRELALVILDIDNFKIFNDKYGHQTGDLVLKRMAAIITGSIRSIDVVSRYGGEEFCIIMPDTGSEECDVFIERLRAEIAGFRLDAENVRDDSVITISVGGSVFPEHATTADRLIYCADMALLKAKAEGRNRAFMFQPEFSNKEESSIGGI